MTSILLTLNAIICVALIVLILLQRSDPASGGMFGGAGGSNSPVVRNPLAKPTAVLAALFLVFSLVLAYMNKGGSHEESVMAEHVNEAPALPQPGLLPEATSTTTVTPTVPAAQ